MTHGRIHTVVQDSGCVLFSPLKRTPAFLKSALHLPNLGCGLPAICSNGVFYRPHEDEGRGHEGP